MIEDAIKINEVREIITNITLRDMKDKDLIESLTDLKIILNDFFNTFNFPHGTKKFFLDINKNVKTASNILKKGGSSI